MSKQKNRLLAGLLFATGGGLLLWVFSSGKKGPVLPFFKSPRERVIDAARGEIGQTNWEKYLDTTALQTPAYRVSWCGLFSLWALHKAGLGEDILWKFGERDASGRIRYGYLYQLPMTKDPQPGDMAYIDQPYQHHAIVERVEGNTVYTIDGNSPGASGGIVAARERPRSAFTAFYSIEPLLKRANA